MTFLSFTSERSDLQFRKFMLLDESDNRRRTPIANRVEIGVEVAVPAPRCSVRLIIPRSERDTD